MGASSSNMYCPSDAEAAKIDNMALSTNIVLIPYSILAENKTFHNQPPNYCRGCGWALNMFSKLQSSEAYFKTIPNDDQANANEKTEEESKGENDQYVQGKYIKDLKDDEVVWACELCGVHNRLPGDTVLPVAERQLYLTKKNAKEENTVSEETKEQNTSGDQTTLIFCIDVSGSMAEYHQVSKNGTVTNVTRIDLITEAICSQLKEMKESHPRRKVGLVFFSSRVTLRGDCSQGSVQMNADLNDFEAIYNEALTRGETLVSKPLGENYHVLESEIKKAQAGGGTALGPALIASLALALQGKTGSRIIICTDGLTNEGIGKLTSNSDVEASKAFYDKIGDMAVEKGVSISIITVKGTACKVDALGPLTDRTAGQILRIDPANFDLSTLAANNMIATNVKLKAMIHEGLAFQNEDPHNLQNNNSMLVKHVGSVSTMNEAYFEYRLKNVEELQQSQINLESLDSLPLQAQISYTDLEGNEFVLVVSRIQKLTRDQKEAEKGIKADILTGFVQKQGANLVLGGKTEEARKKNEMWAQHVQKIANNAEMDEENKKVLADFQVQNQQLQALMDMNVQASNAIQKDDIISQFYAIKQQKQSKY